MSAAPTPIGANNYEAFFETSKPLVVAQLNGLAYYVNDVTLDLNAHGATNSASAILPIHGNPDFSVSFAGNAENTPASIYMGWPSNFVPGQPASIAGLTQVYKGLIAQYDPKFTGDLVTFELRSLASPLVDEKIQVISQSATTVQFVKQVCSSFGLTPVIQLGNAPLTVQEVLGAMFVGGGNFAATVHGMKIWDLILQCAQFDNVDVWEDSGTLYYVAPSLIARPTIDIKYGRDLSLPDGLVGSHALMFSKDIEVSVRGYQPRISQSHAVTVVANADGSVSRSSVTKTTTGSIVFGTPNVVTTTYYPNGKVVTTQRTITGGGYSTGGTSQGTESSKQRYPYWLRNGSPAACNALALSRWRQLTQEEYTVQMRMPLTKAKGIVKLLSLIRLHNVPYQKFNSMYYPRKISLTGGKDQAFMYSIDALNHVLAQGAV